MAQWRLGELYEFGRGVPQNDATAAHWYGKAAEAGNMQAQACLALLLESGRGCDRDDVEAARWHLRAAENGHALAQYCVAKCFNEGRGVDLDRIVGLKWLRKSAAAGFRPALDELRDLCDDDSGDTSKAETSTLADDGTDDVESMDAIIGEEPSELLGIAGRLAKQLQHLSDEDVESYLNQLLELPDEELDLSDEEEQEPQ
jgi:TPR repeat protein